MQDLFFTGILCAIALGVFLIKSIFFVIHIINLKYDDEILRRNVARHRIANLQAQQTQSTMSSIEAVVNWKTDEHPRLTEDLRQQFLTKTKTRRTPTSDRVSPRERVPLADLFDDDDEPEDAVPIYTYNPSIGGTQV